MHRIITAIMFATVALSSTAALAQHQGGRHQGQQPTGCMDNRTGQRVPMHFCMDQDRQGGGGYPHGMGPRGQVDQGGAPAEQPDELYDGDGERAAGPAQAGR